MASGTGAHVEDGSSGRQHRLALDVRHLVEGAEQCGDGYLVLVEHRREDTQPRRLAITVIVGNGASHRVADGLHQRMKWVPCQGSYSGFGAVPVFNWRIIHAMFWAMVLMVCMPSASRRASPGSRP